MSEQAIVILALALLFMVLMFLPFLPGVVELFHPRDDKPLVIKLAHAKEARYFGQSFRTRMEVALPEPTPGQHQVLLSKAELVTVTDDLNMGPSQGLPTITWVRGNLTLGAACNILQEVLIEGHARLAADVSIRAVACNSDFSAGPNLTIMRWLDVDGDARIGASSSLGQSCTTGGRLELHPGTTFQHLFGAPVCVGDFGGASPLIGLREQTPRPPDMNIRKITDVAYRTRSFVLADGEVADFDVISTHNVIIGENAQVLGSIKARGPVIIKTGAIVTGSVFSESNITLEMDSRVLKNVFSQERIELMGGAIVGQPLAVCSVVARDCLTLHAMSAVFGYLCTDGEGVISL